MALFYDHIYKPTTTGTTQSVNDNSTNLATTAYVQTQIPASLFSEPGLSTPTTGQTVTVTPASPIYSHIIDPAGLLLALTVNMANGTIAGQIVRVAFSQAITTLTLGINISGTLGLNLPLTLGGGSALTFVWSASNNKWILT